MLYTCISLCVNGDLRYVCSLFVLYRDTGILILPFSVKVQFVFNKLVIFFTILN